MAIALVLILVSVLGSGSGKASALETTTVQPVRTLPVEPDGGAGTTPAPAKVPGAAATIALFKGVPQALTPMRTAAIAAAATATRTNRCLRSRRFIVREGSD